MASKKKGEISSKKGVRFKLIVDWIASFVFLLIALNFYLLISSISRKTITGMGKRFHNSWFGYVVFS